MLSLGGGVTLYMVVVQHIYSFPIYLTATKACRLTGLPAETLNEERDSACTYMYVCEHMHVCECVSASVHMYECVFLGVFVKALTEL